MRPKTRYVESRGGDIAYQVVGEGPVDLVYVPPLVTHLELQWNDPSMASFLKRLASFSRLILFDKRGVGLSDPARDIPTLEQRMEDMTAVFDAADVETAALLGFSEGGPTAALYAATFPERISHLVMFASYAKAIPDDEQPGALTPEAIARLMEVVEQWGTGANLDFYAPSLAGGDMHRRMVAIFERAAATPMMLRALALASIEIDVTHALGAISAPTLVLHRTNDFINIEAARFLARRIPGAVFKELDGSDHVPFAGDSHAVVSETERFVSGAHPSHPPRSLKTVLFSEIDSADAEVQARHEELARYELRRAGVHYVRRRERGLFAAVDGTAKALRCAALLREGAHAQGVRAKWGLHTGECRVLDDSVEGMTVHVGARLAAQAAPDEILVSPAVKALSVGEGFVFEERGVHELKGVPGKWPLFAARPDPTARWHLDAVDSAEGFRDDLRPQDKVALTLGTLAPWSARSLMRVARWAR